MNRHLDPPTISVVETPAKLPPVIWQSLYTAASRGDCTPIVRVQDAGRQFVLIEAEHFERLQRHWVEYQAPEPSHSGRCERVHGEGGT